MDITYTVKRSAKRKRTISLQVLNDARVLVSAPVFTPADEIHQFIKEKQKWIDRSILRQKQDLQIHKAKTYRTGERFLYLGKEYPLETFFEPFENAGVVLWKDCFYLNAPDNEDLRRHYFISWYKHKAGEYIGERVEFFNKMLNFSLKGIKITSAQSRWGSCSSDDSLAFSFRLIMTPPEIIDYVIVHELIHIKEKNHSPRFWKRVGAVTPDYKTHRRWLKNNNPCFIL